MEKLSTLMHQGNQYPQIRYKYIREEEGCITGVCAIGAMILVTDVSLQELHQGPQDYGVVLARLALREKVVRHPTTGCIDSLWAIITDLNDRLTWSIDRIADWLESEGY